MNIEEPKVFIQAPDSDYPSEFLKSAQPFLYAYKLWIEHLGLSTNSEIEKNNAETTNQIQSARQSTSNKNKNLDKA